MDLNTFVAGCNGMRNLCGLIIHYEPFVTPELEYSAQEVKQYVEAIAKLKDGPRIEMPYHNIRSVLTALTKAEREYIAHAVNIRSFMWTAIDELVTDAKVELKAQDSRLNLFSIINDQIVEITRIENTILAECYRIEHGM